MTMSFSLKKVETTFCRTVRNIFWYLEPFRHGSRVRSVTDRQTGDGQTDSRQNGL